jgi:glutamyl-tRNA reductase
VEILLIGLSHKTAPIEVRERLAFTPAMLRSALTHFDATHSQAHLESVREGVILSTCNRLEVYALVHDPKTAAKAIIDFLSYSYDIAPEVFSEHLYIYQNEAAVQHLMQVAAGLDSMVVGEPQILGQTTEAYEMALSQRAAGTVLSALFRAAIHAGKRARTETAISVNSVSISSVAAGLVGQLLGDLSEQQVLLIGAGEMGAIAVRALIKRGVKKIIVANRTREKAVELAQAWGGKAINFQQVPTALAEADILISSTSAPHPILNKELLEPVMVARPNRPIFIFDIAVPRDVDPNVTEIPEVHLRDIDDLQGQAEQNAGTREAEIPRVKAIVDDEVSQFIEWLSSLEATSTIAALRQQIEQVRQQELQRVFNRLALDEREQNLIATMSHRLTNKILHEPTLRLKKETANGNGAAYIATVRELFSLDKMAVK